VQRHQVGVGDVGQRPELLLEAVDRAGPRPQQGLERHGRVLFAVVGLVDDAHPAIAEFPNQLEAVGEVKLGAEARTHAQDLSER
jgi:hypothetical protein